MSTATQVTVDKEEYDSLVQTNTYYKELLDTYDAIKIAQKEKQKGELKSLNSLSDLM